MDFSDVAGFPDDAFRPNQVVVVSLQSMFRFTLGFKTHCKSVLVITVYGFFLQIYTRPLHTRNIQLIALAQTTSIMPKTRRNAYDAAFKLKAI